MKRRIGLFGLLFAMATPAANAQYIENFVTPKLGPAWSFALPGNNGVNTEDPAKYSITGGQFTVTTENTYDGGWRNAPSVTVASTPANYDIRYTLNFPLTNSNTTSYNHAGLLIFTDATSFFQFQEKHYLNNDTNHPNTNLVVGGTAVGAYDNLEGGALSGGPVTYHINKTGTTITLYVNDNGAGETVLATAVLNDADPYRAALYTFLSNLTGKHIGFYHNNNYTGDAVTLSYSNFSTSLPLVLPKTTDNFMGPKLNPTWSFNFVGALPYNEDASHFQVANGVFNVLTQNSGLYPGTGTYIRNSPSVTVQSNAPGDYDLEAAVDATFDLPGHNGDVFPDAGIVVYTDVNTYFRLYTKHTSYNGANYNYANTDATINSTMTGTYDNFATYQGVTGPVLYRIKKTGSTITFSYTSPGATETIMGTVSSTDTDTYKAAVYALLSNLSGKHISLYNDPGFNGVVDNVSFSRFYTDLPLVQPLTFADELSGSSLSGAWSFNVTGNTPVNTEDTSSYTVANGAFNVNYKGGNLGNAINVPSVTVGTGNSGDYWIETAIKESADSINGYPVAMLAVFSDAGNYFEYGLKHNSYNGNNYNQGTSLLSIGGVFTDDVVTDYAGVGTNDNVVVRIVKSGGTITLSILDGNNNEHITGTLTSSSTGAQADAYNFLNSINGKHIGFVTNTAGSGITEPVAFDYLRTSLNIVAPATVTGQIALEGVSDLSAINPAVSLGTVTFEFRTPGTTTVLKTVTTTLTPVGAGSAYGTYSLPGIAAGTYDVAIKGDKQLRVVLPSVVVSGTSATLANVTLPSGDATGDNSVDIGDFGVLVNAYSSDISIAGSGYDLTADFNYDGIVDIGDFGILINEYSNVGAP